MAAAGYYISEYDNTTNLIINYLPQSYTDVEFKTLFQQIGPTKSCKICRNKSTGYSYGFGFVEYFTPEHAQLAIDTLNGHQIENKFIKVALSRKGGEKIKGANLYVRNIPKMWTSDDLQVLFTPYGNIINSKILTDQMTGSSKGVGFILYNLKSEAEAAIEALNNTMPCGATDVMSVRFADDNTSKLKAPPVAAAVAVMPQRPSFSQGPQHQGTIGPMGQALMNRRANRFNPMVGGPQIPPPSGFSQMGYSGGGGGGGGVTLFVYNIGTGATEDAVYKLFQPFGEIKKVDVIWDWVKGQCKGFCFVTMATIQQAQDAIDALNGFTYDKQPLQVKLKTPKM